MSEQAANVNDLLARASALREQIGDYHDKYVESIYAEAARVADKVVTSEGNNRAFDFDRTLDRVEYGSAEFLGHALADRTAFHHQTAMFCVDRDIPSIPSDSLGLIMNHHASVPRCRRVA